MTKWRVSETENNIMKEWCAYVTDMGKYFFPSPSHSFSIPILHHIPTIIIVILKPCARTIRCTQNIVETIGEIILDFSEAQAKIKEDENRRRVEEGLATGLTKEVRARQSFPIL